MYLQYACNTKANWADLLTLKIHHSEKNGAKTILSRCFRYVLTRRYPDLICFSLVLIFAE